MCWLLLNKLQCAEINGKEWREREGEMGRKEWRERGGGKSGRVEGRGRERRSR